MSTPVYVLPDGGRPSIPSTIKVRSAEDVRRAYAERRHAVWYAPRDESLAVLAKALTFGKPRHGLLALEKVSPGRRVLLDALFAVVVEPGHGTKLLPRDELREVISAENREDLFVAARAVPEDDALVLFRGDLRPLIVPLSSFRARPGGPTPNPAKVAVTDHGHTVRLGAYEIAADALLYEFDETARRRAKRRELKLDPSLGAAIRRLRLQRGLSRDNFPSISAKTIARIERGEATPRSDTLAKIARALDVEPEDLKTF